jgi:diacylglycerol kinase (ATP)
VSDREKLQGMGRMLRAFASSAKGFVGAFREEAAFRQELGFACVALPVGLWLGRSGVERALLAAPVLIILIVELLNSAIEATVDHVLAGLAKDIGSAAVMLSFILLGVVWLLVLTGRP